MSAAPRRAEPRRPELDPKQKLDPSEPLGGRAFAEQLPGDTPARPRGDVGPTGRRLPQSLTSTDQGGTGPHEGRVSPFVDHLTPPGPRAARDVDDETEAEAGLRAAVERELAGEPRLEGARVGVAVVGSEVVLLGRVGGRGIRNIVENIAQAVPGVTSVDNQLEVDPDASGGGGV
ncbi:MAG TPA: BON domain-containing protein [Polyangiaceae bacterium]|nr:BON domain-containing protein [Polyangiaceae bacterium]